MPCGQRSLGLFWEGNLNGLCFRSLCSFVSFFPPSCLCLFACSFVCVFALVRLAATPGYAGTKAWVGSTHLSTRHSARVGGPCDCINFTCDKADGRSFVALGLLMVSCSLLLVAWKPWNLWVGTKFNNCLPRLDSLLLLSIALRWHTATVRLTRVLQVLEPVESVL